MNAYIRGIGHYIPKRRMSNNEFTKFIDTSDEWIVSHTGIHYRHIADDNETTSDLGLYAAVAAINDAQCSAKDIECIITATVTPDYPSFPSTACIIEKKLNLNGITAFDISAACSGFVYGLSIAKCMALSGSYSTILLVGTEIFSRIIDWNDRNTSILFGDGAGAAIIGAHDNDNAGGAIIDSLLCTESSKYTSLIRSERPIGEHAPEAGNSHQYLRMDGKEVYLFAIGALQKAIEEILIRNNLSFDDIDWIVPHQANIRIIEAACKRNGYDIKKFYMNIDEYANTSAASIPIALAEMKMNNLLKPGQKIILVGFGAGLSYGANLIIW